MCVAVACTLNVLEHLLRLYVSYIIVRIVRVEAVFACVCVCAVYMSETQNFQSNTAVMALCFL